MLRQMLGPAMNMGHSYDKTAAIVLRPPIYHMNPCKCGCGELVEKTWKRGHCGRDWQIKKLIAPVKYTDDELFVVHKKGIRNTKASHRFSRMRLEANTRVCDECGLSTWRGKPVPIVIDHLNGLRHDSRLENLRLLCRNCDGQTDTFAGKNHGKYA